MRFLVDADVPERICPDLQAAGHDAVHIDEIGLTGGDDHALIMRARDQRRVILSRNKDLEGQLRAAEASDPSLILIDDDWSPSENLATLVLGALTPVLRDVIGAGAIVLINREETSFRPLRY